MEMYEKLKGNRYFEYFDVKKKFERKDLSPDELKAEFKRENESKGDTMGETSLAIKIQPESIGNEYVSAGDIIKKHIEILEKKGVVYFSTDLQIDKMWISSIHTLALYNTNEDMYYLADVDAIRVGVSVDFLPEDAEEFSPVEYGTECARTWFLLSKIEKIDESDLEGYYVLGNPDISVVEKMHQKSRFPRFYFTK